MNLKLIGLLALLLTTSAWASGTTDKQMDNVFNSTGGAKIAVPGVGTVFLTDTNTVTVQNKSLSGTQNTFSNIPVSALASGSAIGVPIGGTGLTSVTANGILYGAGTSPLGVTSAGSQFNVFVAGSGGVPAFGQVALSQSAAVTGVLGHANGGSDSSTLAGAAANFLAALTGCQTSGFFLNWNGTNFVCSAVPSATPALNGGSASPQSVTSSGITLSGVTGFNEVWVVGSGGAVTVTSAPSISACTADGQQLKIHGTDNTNTVKLQDQSSLSGSLLYLNGPVTLGAQQSVTAHCDMSLSGAWVEDSRTQ